MARGPLETATVRPRIIAWVLEGKSDREVVGKLARLRPPVKVSHVAVKKFRDRHADVLARKTEAIAERVVEVTIADKAERIRRLGELYDIADRVLQERGPLARDVKWVQVYLAGPAGTPKPVGPKGGQVPTKDLPDGGWMMPAGETLVHVERFDAGLFRELRGILTDVADELGELPKRPVKPEGEGAGPTILSVTVYLGADGRTYVRDESGEIIEAEFTRKEPT